MDNRGYVANFVEEGFLDDLSLGNDCSIEHVLFSKSRKGVLRGIHYSLGLKKQHKMITCLSGAVLDIVVDIRVNSPTYGSHEVFELTEENATTIFISSGLGHSFQALEENTLLAYATTAGYSPNVEHTINPLDLELALPWRSTDYGMSNRDRNGMSMSVALAKNLLPIFE
jgi:dTDP-4-dehydrorhamnose 3,5-epimerase